MQNLTAPAPAGTTRLRLTKSRTFRNQPIMLHLNLPASTDWTELADAVPTGYTFVSLMCSAEGVTMRACQTTAL